MEIKIAQPPNIEKIKKALPVEGRKGVIYTYGKVIYAPDGGKGIDEPLMYHESTHSIQQGEHADLWWDRYLEDVDFRFVQELEAYQNQYRRFCELVKDRNKQAKFLLKVASYLADPIYGKICTTTEAMEAIKSNKKFDLN